MNHNQIREYLRETLANRTPSEGPATMSARLETELRDKDVAIDEKTGTPVWVAPDFSDIEVMLNDQNGQPLYASDQF